MWPAWGWPVSPPRSGRARVPDGRTDREAVNYGSSMAWTQLPGNPGVDVGLQGAQGYRAGLQHGVVEVAQVEAGPERFARLVPELRDLHLSDLVGESLAGVANIPVDLVDDVLVGLGAVGLEVGDARSRLQPIECIPVSTTSLTARHIS